MRHLSSVPAGISTSLPFAKHRRVCQNSHDASASIALVVLAFFWIVPDVAVEIQCLRLPELREWHCSSLGCPIRRQKPSHHAAVISGCELVEAVVSARVSCFWIPFFAGEQCCHFGKGASSTISILLITRRTGTSGPPPSNPLLLFASTRAMIVARTDAVRNGSA